MLCVMLFGACGDPPVAPDTQVARIEVTPNSLSFDALGAGQTLASRAVNASGEAVSTAVRWASSDPGVVSVDSEGSVRSISNGSAVLTATAGAVTAQVNVEVAQVFSAAVFEGLAPAVLNGDALDLEVIWTDRLGNPLELESGPMDLAPEDPSTLALAGSVSADMLSGRARFTDVSVIGFGYEQRLVASSSTRASHSSPFDLVEAFDQVQVLGASPTPLGLLIDGVVGGSFRNDLPFIAPQSPISVGAFRGILPGEVVAFAPGRAPAIQVAEWTDDPDVISIELPDPVVVDLAIWIVKGPFATQADWADRALSRTSLIWAAERYGVEIGDVEIIDATGNPDASRFFEFNGCSQRTNAQTAIGRREGRINVYYVERVDGGRDRGRNCPVGGEFIVMAERSGDELLSHEIGHSFGLIHIDGLTAQFDRTNVMHSASSSRQFLTEAQVFRTHFDNGSILNLALSHLGRGPVRACPGLDGTPFCPPIGARLWPDGAFAAIAPSTSFRALRRTVDVRGRPVDVRDRVEPGLVTRWLDTDCMLEDNASLDDDLRALGAVGLEQLARSASDPSLPPQRRARAIQGVGLFEGSRATSLLLRFADAPISAVRDEAQYQLRDRR